MSQIEDKLHELGLELPEVPSPAGNIRGATKVGSLLFTSSRAPVAGGAFAYTGKVGEDLDVSDGYAAARLALLNALATIKGLLGSLERLERVVKLTGWINSKTDFEGLPEVMNGASELLVDLLGDRGEHARSVVGVSALPHGLAIEIEVIAEVGPAP